MIRRKARIAAATSFKLCQAPDRKTSLLISSYFLNQIIKSKGLHHNHLMQNVSTLKHFSSIASEEYGREVISKAR